MIINCLWDRSKLYINIYLLCRLEEDIGKGSGWDFVLAMGTDEGVWRREERLLVE